MIVATTRWIDQLTTANATTRAFLFYSLALIAIGLYSVVSSALFSPEIKIHPSTHDLREEPPAVVNLLVNDLSNSTDAPTAVLLHLARRGHVDIVNSDDGIETVALTTRGESGPLRDYEQRVIELVRAAMTAGRVVGPITVSALRDHYAHDTEEQRVWWDHFRESVANHALELRLVVRRCSAVMVRILRVCAVVLVCIGILSLGRSHSASETDPQSWAVGIFSISALLTFVALSKLDQRELRYTRLGSETTSAWLSARSTMQHVGSFADLGPSAINIWGDRMYYATAVGVARETSRRLTLVTGDGAEAWYIMDQRWHHARAAIPKVYGWGGSPWKHLTDSAIPFFVSSAALGSVGAIVWFSKIGHSQGTKVGIQGALNRMLHFPQRLSFSEVPQVLALVVFVGLLWVLRGQMRRATPIYHAILDMFMSRHEQGVVAYEQDGWIGIGNPHSRSMTLYRLPEGIQFERNTQVELVATRFFGRVKRVRPCEPPRPRKPAFS
jgi:Predicted membrane protein (DUF2207)